jgi:hypothetical protein
VIGLASRSFWMTGMFAQNNDLRFPQNFLAQLNFFISSSQELLLFCLFKSNKYSRLNDAVPLNRNSDMHFVFKSDFHEEDKFSKRNIGIIVSFFVYYYNNSFCTIPILLNSACH